MNCYIYYKSAASEAASVISCAKKLQAAIADQLLIPSALQRRPLETEGVITWMEVYQDIPDNFDQIMLEVTAKIGFEKHLSGKRHMEYFSEVD
jgi:hypothetical protein